MYNLLEYFEDFLNDTKRKRESERIEKKIKEQKLKNRAGELVVQSRLRFYQKLIDKKSFPSARDLALRDLKIAERMGWLDKNGYPYVDLVCYFHAELGDELLCRLADED